MTYFDSRDIAAIAICASLWGVLNPIFSPMFFRMTGFPLLCDLMGFAILTIAVWWTRKLGAITVIGLIATVLNFMLNPTGTQFLGFTAASIAFDIATRLIGYDNAFKKPTYTIISMVATSTLSAAIAGYIIATFFMIAPGGAIGWAAIHAAGGVIGGAIGAVLVIALTSRGISARPSREAKNKVQAQL